MNAVPGDSPAPGGGERRGALLTGLTVGAFVLTSSLLATAPAFRFDSQFPALLPFFAVAGAAGVGYLGRRARGFVGAWRAAWGPASLAPYAVLMIAAAVAGPFAQLWWLGLIAAVCAMAPFLRLAGRAPARPDAKGEPDELSRRGTFLIGASLMLMAYGVSGPVFMGSILAVLLAVGLAVASLMPEGLARAGRTWRPAHWFALVWGCLIVWAGALLHGLTSFFNDPWYLVTIVLLAGVPLIVVNGRDSRPKQADATDLPRTS